MADIQEQTHQDALASSTEKPVLENTEVADDQPRNNDEETGPSNLVSRARQSLSDLFTIVSLNINPSGGWRIAKLK